MKPNPIRPSPCASHHPKVIFGACKLAVVCGLWAVLTRATPVRGQCSPVELAKLTASDAADNDGFGYCISVFGDTTVVGAVNDDHLGGIDAGSAYVFVRSGGVWTQQATLIASDATSGDKFGCAVAVFGDTAVVGAYAGDAVGVADAGCAYVFTQTGEVWIQQAKLTALDAAASDRFGVSVSVHGDTAVVGANTDDTVSGTNTGSAYVFTRSDGIWTQQAKLTASDAAAQDLFGGPVAVDGDTSVVAAPMDSNANGTSAGSTYVFTRSGETWTQQAKLIASNGAANDLFGASAALSGNTALVGANGHSGARGSVYVFIRSAGAWTQQAELTASDAAAFDQFGFSTALAGDTAVIGALEDDHPGASNAGSAYLFTRIGVTWSQRAKLIASDVATFDRFGNWIGIYGNSVVVGAWADDHAGGANAGSAYVFNLNCVAACCAGDFDSNHVVDIADVSDFVVALLAGAPCPTQPTCCPGDLNADIMVDGKDIQLFLNKLLSGGSCG